MRSMMLVMALLCLVIGLLPGLVVPLLTGAAGAAVGRPVIVATGDLTRLTLSPPVQTQADADQNTSAPTRTPQPEHVSPALTVAPVIVAMLALGAAALAGTRAWRRQIIMRPRNPWNCGAPYVAQEAQYTGAALSFLIRDLFGAGLQRGEGRPGQEYLPAQLTMSEGALTGQPRAPQVVTEVFRVGYNHVIGWLQGASTAIAGWSQNGDLGRYLLYILFANLTALLLFLVSRR
jgi:hypothetical protein